MLVKKLRETALATAAAGALVLGMGVGTANAASITDLLYSATQFEDDSFESQSEDLNNNNLLDVGDTLRGILKIQTLVDLSGGGGPNIDIQDAGTGNNELAAVFEAQVLTKTAIGGGLFNFTFGANTDFGTEFGVAGAMVVFYEDPNHEFTKTCTTTGSGGDCEGNIIDGTRSLVLGIGGDGGEFWTTFAAPDNVGALDGLLTTNTFGFFNIGLNVLETIYPFVAQVGPDASGTGAVHGDTFGGVNQSPYDAQDDTDFGMVFDVVEPGTLGIMGLGLIGLGLLRRRKQVA